MTTTSMTSLAYNVLAESDQCIRADTVDQRALYRAARAVVREALAIRTTPNDQRSSLTQFFMRNVLNDCIYMMQYKQSQDASRIMLALLFDEIRDDNIDLNEFFHANCFYESALEIDIPRNAECIRGFFAVDSIRRALKIDDEERNF